jgi:hypothetical protein
MATRGKRPKTTGRKPKTTAVQPVGNEPVQQTRPEWIEDLFRERELLLRLCEENNTEREEFQKIAALYCNERAEMILECNLLRESTRLQQMMLESEHLELEVERYRLMGERLSFERMWLPQHGVFPRY